MYYYSMHCSSIPKSPYLKCHVFFLLSFFLFFPSFSDPKISESGLFCSNSTFGITNFIPTFVKEMESLSQIITTHHFATHHQIMIDTNNKSAKPTIYGLAQCHKDLSQTDCLLCYAASRTRLPRCLPSLSARIFLDGCFLRYDNYSFYNESVSPQLDTFNCSHDYKANTMADSDSFVRSVGHALGNVSSIAVRNGGFGVVGIEGVYVLAQCWESVGSFGCKECLEKAAKKVKGCAPRREGRGMNTGCYLRYSIDKFYNNGGGEDEKVMGCLVKGSS